MSDEKKTVVDYLREGFQKADEERQKENAQGDPTTIELEQLPEVEKQALPLHVRLSLGYKRLHEEKDSD